MNGIFPALVTPLHPDGTLRTEELERLLARVYAAGVDGVYVCGTTGEGTVLSSANRRTIAETAVRHSPAGKRVIVHVGAWSVEESLGLAMHAESVGAYAISALPPAGASYAELIENYRRLGEATKLPLLAYYFPASTGITLTVTQLREVCSLPGIIGFKFTDYDLFTLSLLVREGKVLFNGRDEVLSAGLLLGASGGIGSIYNLVPEWFVEIYSHAKNGDWAAARMRQDQVNDLIVVLIRYPFLSALKQVLTWQGINCGEPLPPRLRLTAEQETDLRRNIEPILSLRHG